jgi:hypothetical protein
METLQVRLLILQFLSKVKTKNKEETHNQPLVASLEIIILIGGMVKREDLEAVQFLVH